MQQRPGFEKIRKINEQNLKKGKAKAPFGVAVLPFFLSKISSAGRCTDYSDLLRVRRTATVSFLYIGMEPEMSRQRVVVNFPNVVDLTFPRPCIVLCFVHLENSPTVRFPVEKIRYVQLS